MGRDHEVLLSADVLAHRLIELATVRLVRGYDLSLAPTVGGWVVAGVDTRRSSWWLRVLRRFPGVATSVGAAAGGGTEPERSSETGRGHDWHGFAPLVGHPHTLDVRAPTDGLRAPQLADLLGQSSPEEQAELLTCLRADPELEADVFEELDQQTILLAERGDTEIAAVLARMHADAAAAAIIELPRDRRLPVLERMPAGPRSAVIALLGYNPAAAGGLMGLDFLAVADRNPDRRRCECGPRCPRLAPGALHTISSVGEDRALTGAAGLVTLLQTDPERVRPDTDLAEGPRLMTDYDLLALPVVDPADHLISVIIVDDTLRASTAHHHP